MPSKVRIERIEDRIKQVLNTLIIQKVNDQRLSGVYVNDVTVDRELAFAEIYVSAVEGAERSGEVLEGFKHANSFLRHELASQIDLRKFPDPTPEHADHIEKILASIRPELNKSEETKKNAE
jgi:ribosome-binding factor A